MSLNKIRSGQIKDIDIVTEGELSNLFLSHNIFLTQVSSTEVKVAASVSNPAALTINGKLRANTSDTANLTISGLSGTYDIFAVADDDNSENFTLAFAASGQNPEGATNYRKIGTIAWDGSQITSFSSLNDAALFEIQNPSTNGQQIFNLEDIVYNPGSNDLKVYVNGILQLKDVNYTETDSDTVTFIGTNLTTTDEIIFVLEKNMSVAGGGLAESQFVNLTDDQTIDGNKTFTSNVTLPSSGPTLDDHAVRKGYLGTAATQDVGTGPNNVVQLDSNGRLPEIPGAVRRILFATDAIERSTTNTTATSIGLSVTLNPLSTSSKFAILCFTRGETEVTSSQATASGFWDLYRDSTLLTRTKMEVNVGASSANTRIAAPAAITYVDEPSTTSSITYEFMHFAASGDRVTSQVGGYSGYIMVVEFS